MEEDPSETAEVAVNESANAEDDLQDSLVSSSQDDKSSRLTRSIRLVQEESRLKGNAAAIDKAFDELDLQNTGVLDRSDLHDLLDNATKHIKASVDSAVLAGAIDALLEDAHLSKAAVDGSRVISRAQFKDIFDRHPDMTRIFDDEETVASLRSSVAQRILTLAELKIDYRENVQVWDHARTRWKNGKVALVWIILYLAANVLAFTFKALKYSRNDEALAVFGNCIMVARGSAQCLNLNACLILLPVCRHILTRFRTSGPIRFLFPFDALLEIHMLVGIAILLFVTSHFAAHLCDFHRFAIADEDDIFALFGSKLGDTIPEGRAARWGLLLKQPVGVTGVIMMVCMVVAYPMVYFRRSHFDGFWITHHLLLVMLVALCVHGTGSLLEPFQSVYWVGPPFLLYLFGRLYRETYCAKCRVIDVAVKKGDVVGLRLAKPASWDNYVKAGMYAFLNIPSVSRWQWHPFTLTSAPHEDFIEFHFRNVGDWTHDVHDALEDICGDTSAEQRQNDLVVKVEGPLGASSQGFSDYPILVLVGAGIGVTPMISVLKQLLVEPGQMKRAFLYWTVRDRASFEWFTELVDDIYEQDKGHVLQIRHFLTSVKDDDRDLGAILFHHATRAKHRKTDFDLLLGRQHHHQVEVGRPDWREEFESVQNEAQHLGHNKCGVFLCGPTRMAEAIQQVTFELSKENRDFHFYFTKETF